MVGNIPKLTTPTTSGTDSEILYIPLEFWFNRNAGLALPLIALQYHEVKVNIEFRDKTECYWKSSSGSVTVGDFDECSLFVDYIYLDTDERRRFAQVSHEYLIEQLQYTGEETTTTTAPKIKLNFNHPCKELIWVVQPDSVVGDTADSTYYGKQWFNFTDDYDKSYTNAFAFSNLGSLLVPGDASAGSVPGVAAGGANAVFLPVSFEDGKNPVVKAKLQLNGHDRFSERDGRYFNLVQPYQHHENVPKAGINVYSFALKPEEHQPSGTCNMSRIDNATLQLTLTAATVSNQSARIKIFCVNYNVLRVMSGIVIPSLKVSCQYGCCVTILGKQSKRNLVYNWLVAIMRQQTQSVGKFLKTKTTTRIWKQILRTWGNDLRYSKNVLDWIIRSQAPYFHKTKEKVKVQRADGFGDEKFVNFYDSLRCAPAKNESFWNFPIKPVLGRA